MPAPTTQNFFDASNWVYGYSDSNALPPIPVGLTPFYYKTGQFDSGLLPSGFHGAAFLIPGARPQVIVAFEGTDVSGIDIRPDFLLAQLEADVSLFVGVVPQALRDATTFTREVLTAASAQGIQHDQVSLTGHSLGAAAAAYVSTQTGLDGTTFAAPGLPSNTVNFGQAGLLTNYVDHGDPVGNYSATPIDIEDGFLFSSAIRRVGDPSYTGDVLDVIPLAAAAAAAAPGNPDPVRAGGLLVLGGLAAENHPLTHYGEDLNLLLNDTPVLADASRIVSGRDYAQFYGDIIDRNFLVGDAFYAIRNPDVRAAGVDAEQHYDRYGWREGRDPDAFFSTNGYRAANPDVRAADVNPLQHFDQAGWREGRDPSAAFDTGLYLKNNPDVAAAGIDPLAHYLQYGRAEGRTIAAAIGPTASFTHGSFDAEYYLLANGDVAAAALSSGGDTLDYAYRHYEQYGWREGRDPNAFFDTRGYLDAYGDVKAAGIDPLMHYDTYGWKEGRDPSKGFDTTAYLAAYGDVAQARIDPLTHYLQYGALEGRAPFADGTFGAGATG
ncbi:hypothetical protein [Methylobacterium platani]|uniref:Fungal lipase-like domain-containing protein n=1 Tax=Methylobacterium platani TaxID=427683 RepID=A0A179SFL5_9HYPH|nr:hypothetical protein [Methylobacterium platani]OAS26666.1 hypothetical protein A5481_04230 [Methylobacterium platani]